MVSFSSSVSTSACLELVLGGLTLNFRGGGRAFNLSILANISTFFFARNGGFGDDGRDDMNADNGDGDNGGGEEERGDG